MLSVTDLRGRALAVRELRKVLPRAGADVNSVVPQVAPIVEAVRERGAQAALEYGERFDGVRPSSLRVPAEVIAEAVDGLDADVRAALETSIARIRAVLRRVRPAFAEQLLSFHDLRMDLAAHRVFRGEREVHLSPTEFRLLRHFLEHPGRVFSRTQLLDRVWGSDLEIELRTVDATIRRLRRTLNATGEADLLRTVRAEGYSLDRKYAVSLSDLEPVGGSAEPGADLPRQATTA